MIDGEHKQKRQLNCSTSQKNQSFNQSINQSINHHHSILQYILKLVFLVLMSATLVTTGPAYDSLPFPLVPLVLPLIGKMEHGLRDLSATVQG